MRILIDYRPALRLRSGVGEYAHGLATALVPLLSPADQLTLFSSSWKDRLPRDRVPGASVVDSRVPVRVLNFAWHRLEAPAVERLAGPVDVAHAMHPLMIPARHAAQVVTIHDLYFLEQPDSTSGEIRRDYPALAAPHARRADAVIVNSAYTASQVEQHLRVPAEHITICPPGAPAWAPREPPATTGPILFVGTLEPRKNVRALLGAYCRLIEHAPDTPDLVLAGRATRESSDILAALRHGALSGRTRHLGYVSEEERQRLFRSASMLVLPSLHEGFGIPALEAMTIGLPVVAANRGALPEVIGNAGLLVDPEDESALAAAMDRMLKDRSLALQCVESGITRARSFSWPASASRLLQAYAAAVARRRKRS